MQTESGPCSDSGSGKASPVWWQVPSGVPLQGAGGPQTLALQKGGGGTGFKIGPDPGTPPGKSGFLITDGLPR